MASQLLLLDAQRTIKRTGTALPGAHLGCLLWLLLPQKNCSAHQPLHTDTGVDSAASSRRKAPPLPPGMPSLLLHKCHQRKPLCTGPRFSDVVDGFRIHPVQSAATTRRVAAVLYEPSLPIATCCRDAEDPLSDGKGACWVCPCHPKVLWLRGSPSSRSAHQ